MQHRRTFLLATAAAAATFASRAHAQAFPSSPIKVIIPFAPGGGNDAFGRLVAKQLQDRTKGTVFVDNRAGANGTIGIDQVAKAKPDGYTLATATTGALDMNVWTSKSLPYDPAKNFTYLANMVKFPLFLCVSPALGVNNLQEFIAKAKAAPESLTFSSAGIGNSTHLAGEVLAQMTGTKLLHVPYKGAGPAMAAVVAGEVQFTFGSGPSSLAFTKAGRVLNLGVTDSRRAPNLPDVRTLAEQGVPGYEVTSWGGIVAPAGMPKDVTARLVQVLREMSDDTEFRKLVLDNGMVPAYMASNEFEGYVANERARWGVLNEKLNIRMTD
jgi:tripartite-type tricarboxylate transporter receptor subunit TctC